MSKTQINLNKHTHSHKSLQTGLFTKNRFHTEDWPQIRAHLLLRFHGFHRLGSKTPRTLNWSAMSANWWCACVRVLQAPLCIPACWIRRGGRRLTWQWADWSPALPTCPWRRSPTVRHRVCVCCFIYLLHCLMYSLVFLCSSLRRRCVSSLAGCIRHCCFALFYLFSCLPVCLSILSAVFNHFRVWNLSLNFNHLSLSALLFASIFLFAIESFYLYVFIYISVNMLSEFYLSSPESQITIPVQSAQSVTSPVLRPLIQVKKNYPQKIPLTGRKMEETSGRGRGFMQ